MNSPEIFGASGRLTQAAKLSQHFKVKSASRRSPAFQDLLSWNSSLCFCTEIILSVCPFFRRIHQGEGCLLVFFALRFYNGLQEGAKVCKNVVRKAPFRRARATTQNLVVKFDGEICGGVLVENASDDFPQQKKLENLLPNFAGKFATNFAEIFANFTLEIASAYFSYHRKLLFFRRPMGSRCGVGSTPLRGLQFFLHSTS